MANDRNEQKKLSMDDLAMLISKKKKQNNITPVPRDKNIFPQSYAQSSQWFMQQLATDCIYNVPQSYRIRGKVDVLRLERVLNRILERHEIMRTAFTAIDGVPSQIIEPFGYFKLNVIDLSGFSGEEQEKMVQCENEKLIRTPFNLSISPLWKFVLLKLSENEVILTYTLHHIISDGWSYGVIIKEIIELYKRDIEGKEPLEPLSIQYVDYSEWQHRQMGSDKLKRQLEYWVEQLSGINDCINLPLDAPRYKVQTHRGSNCYFTIPEEDYEAISSFCVKEHITLYHFMISVFFLLLYRYSGDNDICIGTPVANRNRVELEKLIGLFINTVIIRTDIDENSGIADFIQRIRQRCTRAFENAEIPFEKVVERLNISRNSSFSPVFQVLYVQMETAMLGDQNGISDLEVTPIAVSNGSSQFDLSLYVSVGDKSININLEYNTDLFSEETAIQITKDFQKLLHSILIEPNKNINYYIEKIEQRRCCVTVCSTFVSEPLNESMNFWVKKLGMPCNIVFAPYSQVFQQLMFEDSLMRKKPKEINVILLRLEDWIQGVDTDYDEIIRLLNKNTEEFIRIVNSINFQHLMIYICPHSRKVADNGEIVLLINSMENKIKKECTKASVYSAIKAAAKYQLKDFYDEKGGKQWHIPYSREFFAVLGTQIISNVFRKSTYNEKCIYLIDMALKDSKRSNCCLSNALLRKIESEDIVVVVRGEATCFPKGFNHFVDRFIETDSVDKAIEYCENMYKVNKDEIIVISDEKFVSERQYSSHMLVNTADKCINTEFLP